MYFLEVYWYVYVYVYIYIYIYNGCESIMQEEEAAVLINLCGFYDDDGPRVLAIWVVQKKLLNRKLVYKSAKELHSDDSS